MLRIRFQVHQIHTVDPRPVNWPVKQPYWITGESGESFLLVSYADSTEYILHNWPEASNLEVQEVKGYEFTDRFPKPAWFKEPQPESIKNNNPPIYNLVIEDMVARDTWAQTKYGTTLQAFNGRDALLDAYEEAIDLAVYLRQLLFERDGE